MSRFQILRRRCDYGTLAVLSMVVPVVSSASAQGQCSSAWSEGLGPATLAGIYASAVYDDGTGSALYVAGDFNFIGGVHAQSVAKWDGRAFRPVGTPTINGVNSYNSWGSGRVRAMTVYDPDGAGPLRPFKGTCMSPGTSDSRAASLSLALHGKVAACSSPLVNSL